MTDFLQIIINDKQVLEFKRNNRLPGRQRQFLDQMDLDMDDGIELNGEVQSQPDQEQRAQYVAMHLINSLLNENDNMVVASCAYLCNRLPGLKKIIAVESDDQVSVEFDYD